MTVRTATKTPKHLRALIRANDLLRPGPDAYVYMRARETAAGTKARTEGTAAAVE